MEEDEGSCSSRVGDRTTISLGRKINLDDIIPLGLACKPRLDSLECEKNAGGVVEDYDKPFNNVSTVVKNIGEGSTNTKDESPSTPTTCSIVSKVMKQDAHVKDNSPPPPRMKNTTLDHMLGRTTQKSNGR